MKPANARLVGRGHAGRRDRGELAAAIEHAFEFDRKVVVEEGSPARARSSARCSATTTRCLGPGRDRARRHEFYSTTAKYIDEHGARLRIPADLDRAADRRSSAWRSRAFRALSARGMARVDFFLDADGAVCVNEINTIPGFTAISMYPKLWEASGLGYRALIERLLDLAVERRAAERGKQTSSKNSATSSANAGLSTSSASSVLISAERGSRL